MGHDVRMLRQVKKAKKGGNSAYVPRSKALRMLQIPLADFRKLCILKGIYPREPKKKWAGSDKTYYHAKDIKYLSHEPILLKFFEIKTFMKKYNKLVGRNEIDLAKRKEAQKPTYTLQHLVKERYPSFDEALRDMDDALSMLALFQSLPADRQLEIDSKMVKESCSLYDEFQVYAMRTGALRKVFASIKGYYFQAEIMGSQCTWLVPHQFAQELPLEVDFRVMMTFLEFYRTFMKFVNFKLYTNSGWNYPPTKNMRTSRAAGRAAAITVMESADGKDATNDFAATEEGAKMDAAAKEAKSCKSLFEGLKIFISREVPFGPLLFVCRCAGAEVGWEGEGSPFKPTSDDITHYLVDRPVDHLNMKEGCEYVQPQWVLDSFNCRVKLPILEYAPGKVPPPHLSPFVDDVAEGYVPEQREKLNAIINQKLEEEVEADDDDMSDAEIEENFHKELEAEQKGVWASEYDPKAEVAKKLQEMQDMGIEMPKKKTKKEREAEELREQQESMMSNKHKRLLHRIRHKETEKQEALDALKLKRSKINFEEKLAKQKKVE